jgi:flavin-dependent dehydrogenase
VHAPHPADPAGLFRLGDQVGVIPSFSGDGIAIALHSGRLAASVFLAHGHAAFEFHRRIRRDIAGRIRLASLLYRITRPRLCRQALVAACRAWPAALRLAAARTRVPTAALQRAGIAVPAMGAAG